MALFPNVNGLPSFRGKTHTNLVISEGAAPAEDLIISRTNAAQVFTYEYGPEGNQQVVLAKGKIVEVVDAEYDRETGFRKTAVKQATDGTEKAIGVNLHNVYERRRDRMHSTLTKPTVITRNYIEVPLFETANAGSLNTAQTLAEAMRFGAAVSDKAVADTKIAVGDYVVSDRSGNFRKYVKGTDSPEAIVGQVWAKETDLPPAGFLQYYQELVNPDMQDFLKAISATPSPGEGGYPYGVPYSVKGWKPEFEKMLNNSRLTGIPFLTDGFFRAQETRTFGIAEGTAGAMTLRQEVESVRGAKDVTYDEKNNKVVVKPGVRNAAVFIKIKHKLDVTKLANVSVELNGVKVNANDFHVDVINNIVVVYLPDNEGQADVEHTGLKVTLPLIVDPIAGIPTSWDYKGSVGAIRVLLRN